MPLTNPDLLDILERTENAIDPEIERRKRADWRRALDFEPFDPYFDTSATYGDPIDTGPLPSVAINDAQRDLQTMLLSQMLGVHQVACARSRFALNIRANYGTGILPSLFGAEMFYLDDENNTLPTTRPMGAGAMEALLDRGLPDVNAGLGENVFECGEFYKEALAGYPKLNEFVEIYHPDAQGPIDACEMLWGSDIFLALVDRPGTVNQTLELITQTYIAFLRKWFGLFPPTDTISAHWGLYLRGQIMLRNDSLMNLSPDMYTEFVKPFDERVLAEFGGGVIHYCGRATHCVPAMCDSPNLRGVQLSQPHLNDIDVLFDSTLPNGINLYTALDGAMASGRNLARGFIGAVKTQ